MFFLPLTKEEAKLLFKEVIAKGAAFAVLVCWIVYMSVQVNKQDTKINELESKLFDLQNDVIKENTKQLHEFNLKFSNK